MSSSFPSVEERQIQADVEVADHEDLENLIKNHVDSIEKMKVELKKIREQYEDSFNNDPTYKELEDEVKKKTRTKNRYRQEIAKQPSVAMLAQKVIDIRFDINESQKTLSDLLVDYTDTTGAQQLELFDGRMFEIRKSAKLVKS